MSKGVGNRWFNQGIMKNVRKPNFLNSFIVKRDFWWCFWELEGMTWVFWDQECLMRISKYIERYWD